MNYPESLNYLARLGDELHGMKFDLDIIRALFAALDHPESRYPTAVVAGTNGKGSTSAMLACILKNAGYRAGLYTSPHLVRINERIRVNGCEISDREFADCFSEVERVVQSLAAQRVLPHLPSFFEFLTATGLLHFARSKVDFAVLEVGMGGRLDATNVTEPRIAVITNVELDHMQFLGSTYEAIAYEKAGIIKPHRPVVSSCENREAAEVIRSRARELAADLIETDRFATVSNVRSDCGRYAFDLRLNGDCFPALAPALRGRFQMKNAVTAVTAAWRLAREGFKIPHSAVQKGLQEVSWPGRLEAVRRAPSIYDLTIQLLHRRGLGIDKAILERDVSIPHIESNSVQNAWLSVYRDPARFWELYELAEKLVDFEDYFRRWRFNHVTTVERIIGFKRGTGGTSGVSYLRKMLDVVLFPELWQVRTRL